MSRWFETKPWVFRPDIVMEQLEERIVLDASIADANSQDQQDDSQQTQSDSAQQNPTTAQGAVESATGPDPSLDSAVKIFEQDLNVVLISNAIDQIEALSGAVAEDATVVVYDADTDNLGTLVTKLENLTDTTGRKIGHLAIVSHGDMGVLWLDPADDVYSVANMSEYAPLWMQLGDTLGTNARIDLYGCNIGQGQLGESFVGELSTLTGAVVWASNDDTGTGLGGDWILETQTAQDSRDYLLDESALGGFAISLNGGIGDQTVDEDSSALTFDLNAELGGSKYTLISPADGGFYTAEIQKIQGTDTLILTPKADASGSDTIEIEVKQGSTVLLTDTFQFTVTAQNDEPTAENVGITITENPSAPVRIDLVGNPGPNESNQTLTFVFGDLSALQGTLFFDAAGVNPVTSGATQPGVAAGSGSLAVWFLPDQDFTGATEFEYSVQDDGGTPASSGDDLSSDLATVSIAVDPVPPADNTITDVIRFEDSAPTTIDLNAFFGRTDLTYEVELIDAASDLINDPEFAYYLSENPLDMSDPLYPTTHPYQWFNATLLDGGSPNLVSTDGTDDPNGQFLLLDYAPDQFGVNLLRVTATEDGNPISTTVFSVAVLPVNPLADGGGGEQDANPTALPNSFGIITVPSDSAVTVPTTTLLSLRGTIVPIDGFDAGDVTDAWFTVEGERLDNGDAFILGQIDADPELDLVGSWDGDTSTFGDQLSALFQGNIPDTDFYGVMVVNNISPDPETDPSLNYGQDVTLTAVPEFSTTTPDGAESLFFNYDFSFEFVNTTTVFEGFADSNQDVTFLGSDITGVQGVSLIQGDPTTSVWVGDVDNDGDLDLVVSVFGDPALKNENEPLLGWGFQQLVYRNDTSGVIQDPGGDESFTTDGNRLVFTLVEVNLGEQDVVKDRTNAVVLGDINNDGWLDLVRVTEEGKDYFHLNGQNIGDTPVPVTLDFISDTKINLNNSEIYFTISDGDTRFVLSPDDADGVPIEGGTLFVNPGTEVVEENLGGEYRYSLDVVWVPDPDFVGFPPLTFAYGAFQDGTVSGDTDNPVHTEGTQVATNFTATITSVEVRLEGYFNPNDPNNPPEAFPEPGIDPAMGVYFTLDGTTVGYKLQSKGDIVETADGVFEALTDVKWQRFGDTTKYFIELAFHPTVGATFDGEVRYDMFVPDQGGGADIDVNGGDLYVTSPSLWQGFGFQTMLPEGKAPAQNAFDVALGDLNNDGWLDVVVATNQFIRIYANTGTGSDPLFEPWLIIEGSSSGQDSSLGLGDYNADGFLDIFTGDQSGLGVDHWYINPGYIKDVDLDGAADDWGANEDTVSVVGRTFAVDTTDIDASLARLAELQKLGLSPDDPLWLQYVNDIDWDVATAQHSKNVPGYDYFYLFEDGQLTATDGGQTLFNDGFESTVPGFIIPDDSYTIIVSDLDGDGVFDILIGNSQPDTEVDFQADNKNPQQNPWYKGSIVEDPDGTARLEFSFAGYLGTNIDYYAWREGKNQEMQLVLDGNFQTRGAYAADFDGDGITDIFFGNRKGFDLILWGQGFSEQSETITKTAASAVDFRIVASEGDGGDGGDGGEDPTGTNPETSLLNFPGEERSLRTFEEFELEPLIGGIVSEFDASFSPRPLVPSPPFLFQPPVSGIELLESAYEEPIGKPAPEWASDLWEFPEYTDAGADLRPEKGEKVTLESVIDTIVVVGPSEAEAFTLAFIEEAEGELIGPQVAGKNPDSAFMFSYPASGTVSAGPVPQDQVGELIKIEPKQETLQMESEGAPPEVYDLGELSFQDGLPGSHDPADKRTAGSLDSKSFDMRGVRFEDILT